MNKAKLLKMAPAALTMVACLGVICTAITSARAALRARDILEVMPEDTPKKEKVKVVIKEAALPTAVAAGTIGSFIFARSIDKKIIAGLSAAAVSMSVNANERYKQIGSVPVNENTTIMPRCDVIIDEDGEIYYESTGNIYIKIKPEKVERALYKVNGNYNVRNSLASVYEIYKSLGLTNRQIKDLGLSWTEFIGWSCEWGELYNYENHLALYTAWHNDSKTFRDICTEYPPMPLCADPPRYVKDICGYETEDLMEIGIYDKGEDVKNYINNTALK